MNASGCSSSAWPTATASMTTGAGSSGRGGGDNLQTAVAAWPTPTVKGNHNRAGVSPKAGDGLATQAGLFLASASAPRLQAPPTSTDGGACSPPGPTSPRRLNPSFVEWLMGWPEGWTLLALEPSTDCGPIACGCSETAFTRWRRLMRSELSRLVSLRAEVLVQHDLFG